MDDAQMQQELEKLTTDQLKNALVEIREAIDPFLSANPSSQVRSFDRQLVHDVRNILNELGLLRALVPDDEQ